LLALQATAILSEFGVVTPENLGNRVAYANAMSAGTSAAIRGQKKNWKCYGTSFKASSL